jgi:hypothetical protein
MNPRLGHRDELRCLVDDESEGDRAHELALVEPERVEVDDQRGAVRIRDAAHHSGDEAGRSGQVALP